MNQALDVLILIGIGSGVYAAIHVGCRELRRMLARRQARKRLAPVVELHPHDHDTDLVPPVGLPPSEHDTDLVEIGRRLMDTKPRRPT